MSPPTGRVLTLLELLQSGGVRTMAELADRLGVDGRTVRRYVGQLVDLGLPVESVRGRYGGYRLARGYRLPPLMLDDDEALAVLLGLIANRRASGDAGDTASETASGAVSGTASETAAAKIRRVLPERLVRRLDALMESLAFTGPPAGPAGPDAAVLLTIADAVRHRRPVSIRYADRAGRRSDRTLHPYGIVSHAGRWYVTGEDPGVGENRIFRLDRVADARALPGSFEAPAGRAAPDPAQQVLSGFATASYRHEVTLRIHGTAEHLRTRLPASVATLEEIAAGTADGTADEPAGEPADGTAVAPADEPAGEAGEAGSAGERWWRVELRAERLDWLPAVLAALDRPFVIERPGELRDLVLAAADRLAARARRA
ncbi:helix-turn-helix transcriptional regulator [Nonomuraea sp. NPDC049684]|uniref:helix-turn-helix transcriptional regulator n=1 Tax=Nonomuraea sp. NPDC049684 TaxID=3364356 RepID=UPI00378DC80B